MLSKRQQKHLIKLIVIILAAGFLSPGFLFLYFLTGFIDFRRNHLWDLNTFLRYFAGNGLFTWILSPFNVLLDLFCPSNPGIYQLTDLPEAYQQELKQVIKDVGTNRVLIMEHMENMLEKEERGMLFFKWYGDNQNASLKLPCFHRQYQYVKTIGVSAFNRQKATTTHFGPLRITLRVLYNLSPETKGDIYIKVADKTHHWKDNPLFIFDDTLQHQSVNYSDSVRHCMFIDIIRPSYFPSLFNQLLRITKRLTQKSNHIFYKKWVLLK